MALLLFCVRPGLAGAAPLQITGLSTNGLLTWTNTDVGAYCAVQTAGSLTGTFTNVPGLENVAITNTVMTVAVSLTSEPERFYRIAETVNVAEGLVAYYPFEGNGNDLSGNANNATVAEDATFGAGISGEAAVFDGSSSYFMMNQTPSLMLAGPMTITAWVNPVSESDLNCIVDKDYDLIGYNLYLNGGGVHMRISSPAGTSAVTAGSVPLNVWSHVAGVYTGSAILIYINGVQVGQTSAGSLSNCSKNLYIGMWGDPGFGRFFQGKIDNVRIYNRALNAAEVLSLADQGQ